MVFNSLEYLIFLPVTVIIFHIFPDKYKYLFLLFVSYFFYFWLNSFSPIILLLTTIVGYFFAIKIKKNNSEKRKRVLLFISIFLNLLILILFREVFKSLIPSIGVSFFTFQNISYLIDCYLEKIEPEKNFFCYALYLSFFPKLLQGPIERPASLIPQLKGNFIRKYEMLRLGAQLFMWGMFKKIVIADNIALVVNETLNNINDSKGLAILALAYLYAIQIYCDFSGYTDMALGSAKLFGINLTDNFNYPYFAVSIQDFWRRWHITLSSWILDYIFKPLQMKWRNYGNYGLILSLIITFILCGIWHGMGLNYILWGLYHGILISISFLTYKKWNKFVKNINKKFKWSIIFTYFLEIFVTFNLVCFSWLIFMTKNIGDVILILRRIYGVLLNISSLSLSPSTIGLSKYFLLVLLIFLIIEVLQMKFKIKEYFDRQHIVIRFLLYNILIMTIIFFMNCEPVDLKFIYFQF